MMVKRSIIKIDEKKCTGCGQCIPNCPEGALQMIDGKARLVSDLLCDGLGACIGHCPFGAIKIEKREAKPYDEKKVMQNMVKQGMNVVKAHLKHLKDHGQAEFLDQALDFLKNKGIENPLEADKPKKAKASLPCGCPGSMVKEVRPAAEYTDQGIQVASQLRQWPVQLSLIPPGAPFFRNSHLLISADCVGFANPNFHNQLLKGHALAIGCPKLDDLQEYKEKISAIVEMNDLKKITVAIMEVPCCSALYNIVQEAVEESGKDIKLDKVIVSVEGKVL